MTVRLALVISMVLLVALAGCDSGVAPRTPTAPPSGAAVAALRTKVRALQADQCQRLDPRAVYPQCGRYVTEVAGTVGALRASLAGRPVPDEALARLSSGVSAYQGRGCDGPAAPVDECAAALTTLRTALAQLGDTLPTGG